VTELNEEVRGVLREQGSDQRLLLATFFAACDGARDAATKRVHSVPAQALPLRGDERARLLLAAIKRIKVSLVTGRRQRARF
jgi:hypothetical protein